LKIFFAKPWIIFMSLSFYIKKLKDFFANNYIMRTGKEVTMLDLIGICVVTVIFWITHHGAED